jgi:phospholipid/cholesterol/gamma-HCH transport system substrate-binding protein
MPRANRTLELGTGLFVLLGFAALAFLTTQLPGSGLKLQGSTAGYNVTAKFDNIGDLKVGAPVTMAGVRIGRVTSVGIDSDDFKAAVKMRIDKTYAQIPDDSDAAIQTAGLLGAKYVGIGAGGSSTFLAEGSEITFTQPAIVLENLVNKLFASVAGSKKDDSDSGDKPDAGKSDAAKTDKSNPGKADKSDPGKAGKSDKGAKSVKGKE